MKTQKAICKWWNDSKGYGFVTCDGKDIFCHYTALKGDGFKTLRENQTLTVLVQDGPKGSQVVECLDWNKV
jgi:cold shock protein